MVRYVASMTYSHEHGKHILSEGVAGQTSDDVIHFQQLGGPYGKFQRVLLAGAEFSLVFRVGSEASHRVASRGGIQGPLMILPFVVKVVWKKGGLDF